MQYLLRYMENEDSFLRGKKRLCRWVFKYTLNVLQFLVTSNQKIINVL